jgi:hypothetical protein
MTLKNFLLSKGYQLVRLTKSKTGHLYLDVKINKTKGVFILDTGAGGTIIEISKKDQFNLSTKTGKPTATGAGGGGLYIENAENCKFQIGKYSCDGFKLNLMDLSHVNNALLKEKSPTIDGIIGSDILTKARGIIDYKKLHLFLKEN